jgi:hypothetical protein
MDNIQTPSLAECLPRVPPKDAEIPARIPEPAPSHRAEAPPTAIGQPDRRRPHERDLAETHRDSEIGGACELRHEGA